MPKNGIDVYFAPHLFEGDQTKPFHVFTNGQERFPGAS